MHSVTGKFEIFRHISRRPQSACGFSGRCFGVTGVLDNDSIKQFNLRKRKIAVSVLLKLFINGHGKWHSIDAPIA